MAKKLSIKELAAKLEPEQLGLNEVLLYRPAYPDTPQVRALIENSGWKEIKGTEGALQAYPTLENLNALTDYGLTFNPTKKVALWFREVMGSYSPEEAEKWRQHTTLFDYQQEASCFLYYHDRAMLSLSPGLGKTLTSAYAAGLRGFDNVLVVCPASLLFYWKGELEKWADKLPRKPVTFIWHKKPWLYGMSTDPDKQYWAITNPETVTRNLDLFIGEYAEPFECLIVDESIMYKHRNSNRSKALKNLANYIDVTWLLTGAPATRYLDDMWHQFYILKPKGYSSYWRFAKKYCIIEDNEWGSKVVANRPNIENEIKKNFADVFFARSQDDVLNIPDWIFEDIDIPMLEKQDTAYEILRKELYVQMDSLDPNDVIKVGNHLSLVIRSIQVASNPLLLGGVDSAGKWDALPELMEIYPGPHIVWCNFIKTGEILRDKFSLLKKRVALANGSTSMEDRNSIVDSFQRGELDTIILNNQVGKFGFNLTKARTAFFVERVWDDSYYQCLHRNRRIGTTESPIIVNLMSVTLSGKKTIDHLIGSVLGYRNSMIRAITARELKEIFRG